MVVEWIVFLTDKLVGLLILLDNRVANLSILTLQLSTGKVLHDASPERVTQHVGGGPQTVPGERESDEMYSSDKQTEKYCCISAVQTPHSLKFTNVPLNTGFLICHSALCINNLCSGGTSGLSEALQWHLGWQTHRTVHRPIPIKLTFSGNSQEPIHSDDQCYVLCGQSHRCQYDHHGNQASLRDACCSDAGSRCCDTEWAVGGMETRAKTFNKRETNKQHMCTPGGSSRVLKTQGIIKLCKLSTRCSQLYFEV